MQNITVDSWNRKNDEIIAFMSKHNIEILNIIPTKSVLLEKIILKNIKKQYAIDSMFEKVGYSVSASFQIKFHRNGMCVT